MCTGTIDMQRPGASLLGALRPCVRKDSHPNRPEDHRRGLEASNDPFNSVLRRLGISIHTPHTWAEPECSMRAVPCRIRILSSYRCNRVAPVRHLLKRGLQYRTVTRALAATPHPTQSPLSHPCPRLPPRTPFAVPCDRAASDVASCRLAPRSGTSIWHFARASGCWQRAEVSRRNVTRFAHLAWAFRLETRPNAHSRPCPTDLSGVESRGTRPPAGMSRSH
jgi:hypothetical protein